MAAAYTSPSLARVARGDLCAGCGACAGLAPGKVTMQVTEPGYLRPVQSAQLNTAQEAAIAAACPGLTQTVIPGDRTDDALWGPYVWMKTGHATDPAVRYAGSSGGGLSAMLIHLVQTGVVDAVLANGADPDLPIGNITVIATGEEDITAAAGSRYAPSAPLARLAELKADGRRFAFVGKPCDVAALRALMARDASLNSVFPVLLSFFCAGVPSHTGGQAVLKALGTSLDDTASFRFRGNGWPGRATARDHAGQERDMSYHDSWGKILSRHVQHRCKVCADGTGTAADIVCADAWDCDEAGYPVFEEGDGTSLIVARTAHGAKLLADAETAGTIDTHPFDVATLAAIQPGQRERRRALMARLIARRLSGLPIPSYTGLKLTAAARQNPLTRSMKNFLGMLRRSLRNRPRTS